MLKLKVPKIRLYDRRQQWKALRLRHKILVILAALLVVGAAAVAAYFALSPKPEPGVEISKKAAITTVRSPLTGVRVPPELAKRPVTAIMIENSLEARPQSGLIDAGVVFEATAEGGITRFIALFQETSPQYIGPVRSLRPHYIDFAAPFDAGIAHVGGSPEALAQIRSDGKDLDQFFNSGSYWRVAGRRSPHNVYTSFEKLDDLNKRKGYTSSKFVPWPRKSDQPPATGQAPTARSIDLNISSANFNVHYDYDAATNAYARTEGGKAHTATNSATDTAGQQLRPKVVMALVMTGHFDTTGSGQLFVFQDGGVITGTWAKSDRKSQFVFADANSQPIKLNAGQTWVTIVGNAGQVVYNP